MVCAYAAIVSRLMSVLTDEGALVIGDPEQAIRSKCLFYLAQMRFERSPVGDEKLDQVGSRLGGRFQQCRALRQGT